MAVRAEVDAVRLRLKDDAAVLQAVAYRLETPSGNRNEVVTIGPDGAFLDVASCSLCACAWSARKVCRPSCRRPPFGPGSPLRHPSCLDSSHER